MSETESVSKLKESLAESEQIRKAGGSGEIRFDNNGNMYVDNRSNRRKFRALWRAPQEGKNAHYYTRSKSTRSKMSKTNRKKSRKQERTNKRKGRK